METISWVGQVRATEKTGVDRQSMKRTSWNGHRTATDETKVYELIRKRTWWDGHVRLRRRWMETDDFEAQKRSEQLTRMETL